MIIWIDYAIILVIAFSCLISLTRGFVREILSLITWSYAYFIAGHYYTHLSPWVIGIQNKLFRNGIVIVGLFMATVFAGNIISFIICQLIKRSWLLSIDKGLGICFGALRGVFIVIIVLFTLDTFTFFPANECWKNSQLIPYLKLIIKWLLTNLQNSSIFHLNSIFHI